MQLKELETLLTPYGGPVELTSHWNRFQQAGGDEDIAAFLAFLHREKLISTRVFGEVLASSRLEVETVGLQSVGLKAVDGVEEDSLAKSRYRFLGLLGHGSMGEVHVATDRRLRRSVAIKRMNPRQAERPKKRSRFLHEAQITAQLDHPGIVPVYDLEEGWGVPTYSMKLIHGTTLEEFVGEIRELVKKGRPLKGEHSLDTRLDYFLKVCDALAYAHNRGVLHRDLKPDNIMVGRFNEVYVMDWGLAKPMDPQDSAEDTTNWLRLEHRSRTAEYQVQGTPAFMSPEQARGEPLDFSSDQYSLGLILYELVTLRRARLGRGLQVLALAGQGGYDPITPASGSSPADEPPPPPELPVEVLPDLAAIVEKSTALNPADRYLGVAEMAEDVRRFRRSEPLLARPETLWERLLRGVGRHREILLIGVLLAFLTAVVSQLVFHRSAALHEEHLGRQLGAVAEQAARVESYFLKLEGLLEGLAAAARHLLAYGAPQGEKLYFSDDFSSSATAPPDLLVNPGRYRTAVSFGWPVFKLAPGVERQTVIPALERLILLRHQFRQTFLRSFAPGEQALTAPGNAPLIWSYVALESGVHTSYPGHTGYPEGFDPRQRPWYRLGARSHAPQWDRPHIDVNGLGLILPCVTALRTTEGQLLGVVGIELTLDLVIDQLLVSPDLPEVHQVYLTDGAGRVMVESSNRGLEFSGGLHGNQNLETGLLPLERVLEAIQEGRSGYMELGSELVIFDRLDALGWYLVVRGPTGMAVASLLP